MATRNYLLQHVPTRLATTSGECNERVRLRPACGSVSEPPFGPAADEAKTVRLDRGLTDSPKRRGSELHGLERVRHAQALQLTVSQRRLADARDAASKTRWFCKPSWKSGRMGSPEASACSQS